MALPTFTSIGTISVGAGGTTVTGDGTAFKTLGVKAGDQFVVPGSGQPPIRIAADPADDSSLTLAWGWTGSALTDHAYEVQFTSSDVSLATSVRAFMESLANGGLGQIAAASTGAADGNILQRASGAWTATTFTAALAAGLLTTDGDMIQRVSGAAARRTPTQIAAAVMGLAPDGTVGAPGIAFAADTDNGLFRSATNQVDLVTAGATRIRTLANGHVLVGTTVDSGILSVAAGANFTDVVTISGAATAQLNISGPAGQWRTINFNSAGVNRWFCGADPTAESGSNTGDDLVFNARADDGSTTVGTALRFKRDTLAARFGGKVGIGVNPTNLLDVALDQNTDTIVRVHNASSGAVASAQFYADNGTHYHAHYITGTGFAGSGGVNANDRGVIFTNAANGLALGVGANAGIHFYFNQDTRAAYFDNAGRFRFQKGIFFDVTDYQAQVASDSSWYNAWHNIIPAGVLQEGVWIISARWQSTSSEAPFTVAVAFTVSIVITNPGGPVGETPISPMTCTHINQGTVQVRYTATPGSGTGAIDLTQDWTASGTWHVRAILLATNLV